MRELLGWEFNKSQHLLLALFDNFRRKATSPSGIWAWHPAQLRVATRLLHQCSGHIRLATRVGQS